MNAIQYRIDGKMDMLEKQADNWSKTFVAPKVAGEYPFALEVRYDGGINYLDIDPKGENMVLKVIDKGEDTVDIKQYLPPFWLENEEFKALVAAENVVLNQASHNLDYFSNQCFIESAGPETMMRLEKFLSIKGEGTLEQRKNYLLALLKKGDKLSETTIKTIVNTITGSDAIVTFYAENDVDSPQKGKSILQIQVLSPDEQKNYRYDDILRTLQNLIPAHIELSVIKYFATWHDLKTNFEAWESLLQMGNWKNVNDYIPPL